MAIILPLLQTVPFWNLGNETGGLFLFLSQGTTGRQPRGTGPSLQDQLQDCETSTLLTLLYRAFSSLPGSL